MAKLNPPSTSKKYQCRAGLNFYPVLRYELKRYLSGKQSLGIFSVETGCIQIRLSPVWILFPSKTPTITGGESESSLFIISQLFHFDAAQVIHAAREAGVVVEEIPLVLKFDDGVVGCPADDGL